MYFHVYLVKSHLCLFFVNLTCPMHVCRRFRCNFAHNLFLLNISAHGAGGGEQAPTSQGLQQHSQNAHPAASIRAVQWHNHWRQQLSNDTTLQRSGQAGQTGQNAFLQAANNFGGQQQVNGVTLERSGQTGQHASFQAVNRVGGQRLVFCIAFLLQSRYRIITHQNS